MAKEIQTGALYQPRGVGWIGRWEGVLKGRGYMYTLADSFPGGSDGKHLLAMQRPGFDPWVGKIPWRRKWQPTLVFLPGKSHGQKNLAGYSPWSHT